MIHGLFQYAQRVIYMLPGFRKVHFQQLELEASRRQQRTHFVMQQAASAFRERRLLGSSRLGHHRLRFSTRLAAAATSRAINPYLSSSASGGPDSAYVF